MDQLILTSDGSHSLLSGRYGVSYHSRYGAVQETEHVFLQAALRYYLKQYTPATLSVLEMGFGTGLNAFMTLLEAEARQLPVHFTTIEAYPIQEALADQLNFPEVLQAPAADPWFRRLHRCSWETAEPISPFFTLEKKRTPVQDVQLDGRYQLVYFDAFAPDAQPELWEAGILQKMFDALQPGGVLTTYCAKGAVKRTLRSVGFTVESLAGPPGKREMTRALKPI